MRVGFVGLGKLGLPMALAAEKAGHEVAGWDAVPEVRAAVESRKVATHEVGVPELLHGSRINLLDIPDLVVWADLLFVVVQTPHQPQFEGVTPLGDERADFDYTHLVRACAEIGEATLAVGRTPRRVPVAVVSTVLPGTMDERVRPVLGAARLVYNPSLIAMGTALPDFERPEMVLVGVDDPDAAGTLRAFYKPIHDRPVFCTDVRTAELVKVAYNVFIGLKLGFINTMAQLCDVTGADVDGLTEAIGLATDRLLSTKYLSAGMGDGGGCHPRDQIALSWLAGKHNLGHDLFAEVIANREAHTWWLAERALNLQSRPIGIPVDRPIIVLGKAYKANSSLTVGSPAVLLANLLGDRCVTWDPHVDSGPPPGFDGPAIYIVATRHDRFAKFQFPTGSHVIDPWGYIPARDGVTVDRPGRQSIHI